VVQQFVVFWRINSVVREDEQKFAKAAKRGRSFWLPGFAGFWLGGAWGILEMETERFGFSPLPDFLMRAFSSGAV
jgi:hypothetical protein